MNTSMYCKWIGSCVNIDQTFEPVACHKIPIEVIYLYLYDSLIKFHVKNIRLNHVYMMKFIRNVIWNWLVRLLVLQILIRLIIYKLDWYMNALNLLKKKIA